MISRSDNSSRLDCSRLPPIYNFRNSKPKPHVFCLLLSPICRLTRSLFQSPRPLLNNRLLTPRPSYARRLEGNPHRLEFMHPFSILTLGIFVAGYTTARWDLVTRLYELAIFAWDHGVVVCLIYSGRWNPPPPTLPAPDFGVNF